MGVTELKKQICTEKIYLKRLPVQDKSAYCTVKLLQNKKLRSDWHIYVSHRSQGVQVFNWFNEKRQNKQDGKITTRTSEKELVNER